MEGCRRLGERAEVGGFAGWIDQRCGLLVSGDFTSLAVKSSPGDGTLSRNGRAQLTTRSLPMCTEPLQASAMSASDKAQGEPSSLGVAERHSSSSKVGELSITGEGTATLDLREAVSAGISYSNADENSEVAKVEVEGRVSMTVGA